MMRSTLSLVFLLAGSVSAFAAADSGLLSLIPSDAQTVASMDVDSSRSSNFGQFILRQMSTNDKSFQDMIAQTGFDPRRDLQSFVFATMPSSETGAHSRFVLIARGLFDQNLITARAKANGMELTSVAGSAVLVSTNGTPKALAFPETGIAAFGDRRSVEQVLGNRAAPSTLSADLQAQISSASSKSDAWFASTVSGNNLVSHLPQGSGALGGSQQGAQVMQAVLQSSGGIQFGANVQLSFTALTRSSQDATSLADFVRFISSMIQMQRQNDPRAALLAPAIDAMSLRADGRQVYTSLVIPEANLEQLVGTSKPVRHARQR